MEKDTKYRFYLHSVDSGLLQLTDEKGKLLPFATVLSVFTGRTVYALKGNLGAGKTTFVRCLCQELGTADIVNSPSFALINVYDVHVGDKNRTEEVYHFDLYRLSSANDAYEIGVDEYFNSGKLCFVEWPDVAVSLLPADTVVLEFEIIDDSTRRISVSTLQC
jgi:tRNA threonylcarbamoyladenosine biosynthesis protein TsaE